MKKCKGYRLAVLTVGMVLCLAGCGRNSSGEQPEAATVQTEAPLMIQGQILDGNTRELTLNTLTQEEAALLEQFSQLTYIDARECDEPALLARLQRSLPQCRVDYLVTVGDQTVAGDCTEIRISGADLEEAARKLPWLPGLVSVKVDGSGLDNEQVYALQQLCPEAVFQWEVSLLGITADSTSKELDLSGIEMENVSQVEENLKYFPQLEKVIMCDCGIPSEEMDALWKRNPQVRFVWNIRVAGHKIRTDVTTFMPFQLGFSGGKRLSDGQCGELKYLVDVVCMDLGHMNIQDISFVSYMPNLEYLLLCGNSIRDISPLAGLEKLKYLEGFANSVKDISPLAQCPALEDVNFCYNPIEDLSPLFELENLNNIWLSGWMLDKDQLEQLQEVHKDAKIVLDSPRSTGAGWRDLPNYFAQRDLLGMFYMTTD